MQDMTFSRIAALFKRFKQQGGSGTTVVLVDHTEMGRASTFIRDRIETTPGEWRIDIVEHDPASLQGEARRRFEDGVFERDRMLGRERTVYFTLGPFYVIPSVKDRILWLDARGQTAPRSRAAKRDVIVQKAGPTDTLWYQNHRGDRP